MVCLVEIDCDRVFMFVYELFWSWGYVLILFNGLLVELGIGRSSFYVVFVSKEVLFVDVFVEYWE